VPVLLRADVGEADADIADDLGISAWTVANARKRFAAEGPDAARTEKPRSGGPAVLDGKAEAVRVGGAARLCPMAGPPGRPGG
jgi:transposase